MLLSNLDTANPTFVLGGSALVLVYAPLGWVHLVDTSRPQLALLSCRERRSWVGSYFSVKTWDTGCLKEVLGGKGPGGIRLVFLSANLLWDQSLAVFKCTTDSVLGAP